MWLINTCSLINTEPLPPMLKGPMAFMLTLPVRDILYPHIFSRLHPLEVWSLRLVCKDLYTISLQYFCTDCSRVHLDNADSPCWTAQLCAVVTILGLCHHLKELSLLATVGVGKEDQFSKSPGLYSCLTALANSTQLTKLKLVSITIDIEHKCLRALSHHCCALEELHLESLPSFSDTAMNSLLSSHSLLTLTRLSLENLPLLRDTVPSLIQSSAQLRTLSVSADSVTANTCYFNTHTAAEHWLTTANCAN